MTAHSLDNIADEWRQSCKLESIEIQVKLEVIFCLQRIVRTHKLNCLVLFIAKQTVVKLCVDVYRFVRIVPARSHRHISNLLIVKIEVGKLQIGNERHGLTEARHSDYSVSHTVEIDIATLDNKVEIRHIHIVKHSHQSVGTVHRNISVERHRLGASIKHQVVDPYPILLEINVTHRMQIPNCVVDNQFLSLKFEQSTRLLVRYECGLQMSLVAVDVVIVIP